MTVLFFARRFYPLIGGVEKHVLEVSKRLVKKGYKIIVITEYEKNTNNQNQQSLPLSATIEGIKIIRINAGKEGRLKKFRIWFELLKYFNLIKSADIVHCHDVFYWYFPFRFIFPFKEVYTTFHGYEGNNIPNKKAIFMHKLSEKLSYGNICVGDYLKKWYGTKPTLVTYGAVDLLLINQYKKNIITNKEKIKNKIVYIGRLEDEAGIMKYLKTLVILKNKGFKLSMDVFGQGSQENDAKTFVTGNNLEVKFKGSIRSTESVLFNYEYVFCSRYLGTLESMAARKQVFVEYNNKIKKDCFLLAPFNSYIYLNDKPEDIANSFIEVINNPKNSQQRIKRAYEWVKNQTWNKMTNHYLSLWKAVNDLR